MPVHASSHRNGATGARDCMGVQLQKKPLCSCPVQSQLQEEGQGGLLHCPSGSKGDGVHVHVVSCLSQVVS